MGKAKALAAGLVIGIGGLSLAVGTAAPVYAQASVSTGVGTPFELAFWQSVDNSTDPAMYEKYLAHYPNGTFADIAQAKIISLRGRAAAQAAPAPAPAPATPAAPAVPNAAPTASALPAAAPAEAVLIAQHATPAPQPVVTPVAVPPEPAHQAVLTPAVETTPVNPAPAASAADPLKHLLAALAKSQSNDATAPASVAVEPASGPATLQTAVLTTGPAPIAPASIGPAPIAPAPVAPHANSISIVMPQQPALTPVAAVAFPPSFCSAEQRNAFHDQVYAPTVSTAQRNNEMAAAYLRQLQGLWDQYQLSRDPDTQNAIAQAAREYEQVAHNAFATQAGLVQQFNALMAVPVVACAEPGKPTNAVLVK